MQLAINTAEESIEALQLLSKFLADHAALKNAMNGAAQVLTEVPVGTQIPPPPSSSPVPPAVVIPAPVIPPVVVAVGAAPTGAPINTVTSPDEFDKSGVPFDSRIHQASKKQKSDGTWKIRKGIDPAIVSTVMKELQPFIRGATPPPAMFPGAAVPPTIPPPPAAPPIPPPPSSAPPVDPPAPDNTVNEFRALVSEISDARSKGRLSPDEVIKLVAELGCPSLQALGAQPALVPQARMNLQTILATR